MKSKIILLVIIILTVFSCGPSYIGYAVAVNTDEESIHANGDIIPVNQRSTKRRMLFVDTGNNILEEVPAFDYRFFDTKEEAEAFAVEYSVWKDYYAQCKKEDLPVRAGPATHEKKVYQLKKGEIFKIIEAPSEIVEVGNYQNRWYHLLTASGIEGYVFGEMIEVFNIKEGIPEPGDEVNEFEQKFLATRWYPESYSDMIRFDRIDLEKMKPHYGMDIDTKAGQISLVLEDYKRIWSLEAFRSLRAGRMRLPDNSLEVTRRGDDKITVTYTDKNKLISQNLVELTEDINQVINKEKYRRSRILSTLSNYENLKSSNYGTIQFSENGEFIWTKYALLGEDKIASNAGNRGIVEVKYFPGNTGYQGVLSMIFAGNDQEVNFLFSFTGTGLELMYIPEGSIDDDKVVSRTPRSPIKISFIEGR